MISLLKSPLLIVFFWVQVAAAQVSQVTHVTETSDLLDLPNQQSYLLKADVSMAQSESKNLRWVIFQDGKVLKSESKMNPKQHRCYFAAGAARASKISAGDYILCGKNFLKSGNGKIHLEFKKSSCKSKLEGFSVSCEPNDSDYDLTIQDFNQILGGLLQLKQNAVTVTPSPSAPIFVPGVQQLPEESSGQSAGAI